MKKTRRDFIKKTSQITLATGFTAWWWTCGKSNNSEESFLEIFRLFTDNMILPRNEKFPIWGWTTPDTFVDFFWNEKKQTIKSNATDGKWEIILQPEYHTKPN